MKHKKSKATDIPQKVKDKVWERDGHRCIICGSPTAMPNAHYISRANDGLGIEQNVVTLCTMGECCHDKYDHGTEEEQEVIRIQIEEYLRSHYPGWDDMKLTYDKFSWLEGVS